MDETDPSSYNGVQLSYGHIVTIETGVWELGQVSEVARLSKSPGPLQAYCSFSHLLKL